MAIVAAFVPVQEVLAVARILLGPIIFLVLMYNAFGEAAAFLTDQIAAFGLDAFLLLIVWVLIIRSLHLLRACQDLVPGRRSREIAGKIGLIC